jgi:enoyl-CoA hydratase/carnithine racemase
MSKTIFHLEERGNVRIVRLGSDDGLNRLTRDCVLALIDAVERLEREKRSVVFAGNEKFFPLGQI